MPVEVLCNVCSSTFYVKPYRENDAKYCSNECQSKSMEKEKVRKICEVCSEEFCVKPSRCDSARFCSTKCYNEIKSEMNSGKSAPGWRGGCLITLSCEFCDSEFRVYKSREKSARFCCVECKHSYLSETLSHNSTDIRSTSEYRKWRRKVKERDGCCVECGSDEDLHAHHITPVSEDKSMATDIENGKTLCSDCHAEVHPDIANLIIESTK